MLKQKFILSYGSKMIVQFITIAASIVVARVAGPTVMGTIAYALAYVQMLGFIADLGLGTAHMKLISEGKDEGKCNSTFLVLRSLTSFIYLIFFAGMFFGQKYILHQEFESKTHEYVIYIILAMMMVQNFQTIPVTTFAAKMEQAKQDIPYMARSILYQIFRIVIVLLGGRAIALAYGYFGATVLVIPLYFYFFKGYPFSGFDKQLAKEYLKIAMPVLVLGGATTLTNTVDKVMLQNFTNSEQVGYYTAGFRIGGFILLISRSMSMLFFPLFSQAVAKKDFGYIKEKIDKFERFSFIFIMPVVILITFYAKDIILLLLGRQYLSSVGIMAIVTVALFLTVFNTPYGNLLNGLGKFNLTAKIALVNLIIYIAMIYLFLSEHILNKGAIGVAWSLLISNILLGLIYRFYAVRNVSIINNKIALKYLAYGIINFLIGYYVFKSFFYGNLLIRISFLPLYIVLTFGSMYLIKFMNKSDLHTVLKLFDLKAMKSYISEELKGKK